VEKLAKLVDAICEVYDMPDLKPHDGETHCNLAVHRICSKLGYEEFKDLMANAIIDKIESSPAQWTETTIEFCQYLANQGELVLAGLKGEPHGHIVVLRPGISVLSSKWETLVPKCINIGKTNSIDRGVNYAFGTEQPKYWVLSTKEIRNV
jgi:hypothetical protein